MCLRRPWDTALRLGVRPLAFLRALGRGDEPHPSYTGRSTQGAGLTHAIAGAFAELPDGFRAEVTYCDATGEPWRADEWSFAYLRTAKHHGEPLDLRHPGDCWGDVGAASAILLLSAAIVDMNRGRAEPTALVWTASDTRPHRGAIVLERAPSREAR